MAQARTETYQRYAARRFWRPYRRAGITVAGADSRSDALFYYWQVALKGR